MLPLQPAAYRASPLFISFWLDKLPEPINLALCSRPVPDLDALRALAIEADHMLSSMKHRAVATHPTAVAAVEDDAIDAVSQRGSRRDDRRRSHQRGRSASHKRHNGKPALCHFHQKYGDNARSCRPGCPKYSGNGYSGRQ